MKNIYSIIILLLLPAFSIFAQTTEKKEKVVDSLVYKQAPTEDATLSGKNIFSVLPKKTATKAGVTIHQSQAIVDAVNKAVASNGARKMVGYRVRIYFDNKQNSRNASEWAVSRFKNMYPGLSAYRTYTNPFFKVTVGDFRTKSEAIRLMKALKSEFPSAFVVKENINYPIVNRYNSYVTDTVRVTRPAK